MDPLIQLQSYQLFKVLVDIRLTTLNLLHSLLEVSVQLFHLVLGRGPRRVNGLFRDDERNDKVDYVHLLEIGCPSLPYLRTRLQVLQVYTPVLVV